MERECEGKILSQIRRIEKRREGRREERREEKWEDGGKGERERCGERDDGWKEVYESYFKVYIGKIYPLVEGN